MAMQALSLVDCFQDIEDHRIERTKQHLLVDILCLKEIKGAGAKYGTLKPNHAQLKWMARSILIRLNGCIPILFGLKRGFFVTDVIGWQHQFHFGTGKASGTQSLPPGRE